MPFMIHALGADVYGTWVLVMSLVGYFGFFDLRIRGAISKYVAEYHAKGEIENINKIVNISLIFSLLLATIIIISALILAIFAGQIFKINPGMLMEFKIACVIVACNIGLILCSDIFVGIIEGNKRQDFISGIEIVTFTVQTILFIVCVNLKYGLIGLTLSILATNILKQLIRLKFCYKVFPQLKIHYSYMRDKVFFKKIFHYSFFLYLFDSVRSATYALPSFMLGSFFGTASITFYSIASRLVYYAITFTKSSADILVPFVSGFDANNDSNRIKKAFLEGSKYSYAVILFTCISLIFIGKPFINLWVGKDYLYPSYQLLVILLLPFLFLPSMFSAISIMKGLGKVKEISFLSIVELVMAILITFLLKKSMGIFAIAVGFSIPMVINYGLILPSMVIKRLELSIKNYIKEVFYPVFFPTAGAFAVFLSWNVFFYPNSYLKLFFETICALAFSIFLFIKLSITKDEKDRIISLIKTSLRK